MKKIFIIFIVTLGSLIYICLENAQRSRTRVVFCDVGQGDAIYLRLPDGQDVLIDAGPYNQVLNCLNQQLPYFDRQIEMAFITHPEKDHYGGFQELSPQYQIGQLFLPLSIKNVPGLGKDWGNLIRQLHREQTRISYLKRADEITVGRTIFTVLTPEINLTQVDLLSSSTEPNLNNLGLGLLIQLHNKQILLMADLDAPTAEAALEQLKLEIDIFKLLHHGSKYGLSEKILSLAHPQLAVLSVGANNFYGHPHPETITLVGSHKIPLQRTDLSGSIEIDLE